MKKEIYVCVLFIIGGAMLPGCGGGSSSYTVVADHKPGVAITDSATIALVEQEKQLNIETYKAILVEDFKASSQFKRQYSGDLDIFHAALIRDLQKRDQFESIMYKQRFYDAYKTLIMDGEILDMRIASEDARAWGGAMAGISHMVVYLKLTDASSGNIVDERIISTHNNAFTASWNNGRTDRSIPADLGRIISAYVSTIIPGMN